MNINVFEDADNTIVQLSDLNKFKICDHDKTLSYDQSHGVNQISQGIAVAKFGQKDLMTNIWSSTVEAWLVFIIIDFVFVGTRNLKLGLVFNIYSVETGNIVTVLPIGIDESEVYEHVQWDVQDPWAVITMQLKNETCKMIGINAREMSLKQFNDSHLNHYFVRLNGNVAIF